jgi:drug/metabolite transporter (DMT)-like permease
MKNQKRAVLLASFVVLFWATVATAFKIALAGMPALTLLLIASITALIVCIAELAYRGKLRGAIAELKSLSVTKRSLWQGFMNPFVYYLILFEGYSLLPAQIAQPLNFSWQVVLIILMAVFMKQKIRLMQGLGVMVSFGGIIMLSMNNSADISGSLSVPGLMLIMASTVIWAVYWMLKIDKSSDPVVELFHNFLAGSLFLLICCFRLLCLRQNLFLLPFMPESLKWELPSFSGTEP